MSLYIRIAWQRDSFFVLRMCNYSISVRKFSFKRFKLYNPLDHFEASASIVCFLSYGYSLRPQQAAVHAFVLLSLKLNECSL